MKHIKIILGLVLFASVSTFAQSPRIKLNQITKDTVKGSVLISSPTDSGMVYSRDFYIAYGADTVLILYGDTISGGGGLSSVLTDNLTITGDGSVGNPLKVDTSTVISTIQGLVDTLTNRGYLTANQTITLSGDVTGSGTTAITATVVDDSHNHIISNVDFLQDSLDVKANDSDLSNYVTLSGTDTITGAKTFTNTLTQSGGDVNFDNNTLFVDESENRVGIGTTNPQEELHIASTVPVIRIEDTDGGYAQVVGSNGSLSLRSDQANTVASSIIDFTIDNSEKMRIDSSGNVGIGTSSPSVKLAVYNSSTSRLHLQNSTSGTTSTDGFQIALSGTNGYLWNWENGATLFGTNGAERMRITSAGNVGIGTSSPQGFFSVERQFPSGTTLGLTVSDPRYEGVFQIKTSSSNSFMPTFEGYGGVEDALLPIGLALQGSVDTSKDVSYATHGLIILQGREYDNFPLGAGPVENAPILAVKNFNNLLMKVEANGNVGIGTTSPSYQLQLSTNSAAKPTSNTWTIASDIRIKKNIVEYNKGLDVIMQINPIEYDYNGLGGFEEGYGGIGIIAQELKPILPEAINSYKAKLNPTDDFETDIMNFDSHPLTFVFINAIQEQQAQIETIQTELDAKSLIIETQEQKITDLETTIQSLITRIEILENK